MLYLLCSELYQPPKGRRSGTTGGSASDAKDQELEVDRLHTLHSVVNSCIQLVPSSMRCITPIPPLYWCSLQPTICPFLKLIKLERQTQRLHWCYRFYQKLFYFVVFTCHSSETNECGVAHVHFWWDFRFLHLPLILRLFIFIIHQRSAFCVQALLWLNIYR